jgi:hypothetical protein
MYFHIIIKKLVLYCCAFCLLRFAILSTQPGYLLSARGTVFGALCAYGFFWIGTTGVLSASVSDFMVWGGGLPFSGTS